MIITPSNKLDAVNEILSTVGSSPVSSLEDDTNVDVLNAKRILESVSKEVQSRGYAFNTLTNVYLQPNAETDFVPYPHEYIGVYASNSKFVNRLGYFFDLSTGENVFPSGITLQEVTVEVPFEELPEAFRKYITVRASRAFQMRYLSSQELDNHLMNEELLAYSDVVDYDLNTGDYNILTGDMFITQQTKRG